MSGLEHHDRELREVDERIARLSLLVGADLSRHDVVIEILAGRFAAPERSHLHTNPVQELRALLVMKYRIEVSWIDEDGLEECARRLAELEGRLRERGLPPVD